MLADTDGEFVALHVSPAHRVQKGQTLAVVEAMNMEFQLRLPVVAWLKASTLTPAPQVRNKQPLITVKADP